MRRICLVGAGFIAHAHAEALQGVPETGISAVVDPDMDAARRLARRWHVDRVFGSIDEALAAGVVDCAHVLVPPPLHRDVALPLLAAGKPVLLEKPLAASGPECAALIAAAARSGATLGVNQNFIHYPSFARLRRLVAARTMGRPRFVGCVYNVPLRQLDARQFGHWMFHAPVNILIEQAVHPLSQIAVLAGAIGELRALTGPPEEIAPGLPFYPRVDVSLSCESLPSQLHFAVGQSFPLWQIEVVCDDGVIVADILANRLYTYGRSRWLDLVDGTVSGGRTAFAILRDSLRNSSDRALSTLRLKRRSDAFFQSMCASITMFHAALDAGRAPEADGRFGAMLVAACERIRDHAFAEVATVPSAVPATAVPSGYDVAILGGTGFIGAHVVRRFLGAGLRVSVMARNVSKLPAVFAEPRVALHRGDIRDAAAVERAIGEAPIVVNLAHGGGGSWEQIRAAMVGGAETVAKICLAKQVRRLIQIGSIASLYLGPRQGIVTGATPPDPRADTRADYARAKAICDRMLLNMHASDGLPVCILRPGVVVGAGGMPFHSGLGFFNNEQHCIGWGNGRNPLPFVLVEDVAEAILLASRAENIVGHCYNLVGDVRLSARDYIAALGKALERPLRFHPQSTTLLWLQEMVKWMIKRATGRAVPRPTRRDFLSRGMTAVFDCGDAQRDLGWQPVSDPEEFRRRAIQVHAG